MIATSILLSVVTTITGGCTSYAQAKTNATLMSNCETIVSDAINKYDYSNYEISKTESYLKQIIYETLTSNNVISSADSNQIRTTLNSDSSFTFIDGLESNFISPSYYADTKKSAPKNDFSFEMGDGGGGGGQQYYLTYADYNESDVEVSVAGEIEGESFYGLVLSKAACKAVYNTIAEWFNEALDSMVTNICSGIAQLRKNLLAYLALAFPEATVKIASVFINLISSFLGAVKAVIKANFVVAIALIIVSFAIVSIVSTMFFCGANNLGFAVGFRGESKEWYCNVYE